MKKFFLTAVFVVIAAFVFAQERIAVFPFEDMDNVLTRTEMIMFYREFSIEFTNRSAGRFSVVPRPEIERFIKIEKAFQLDDFSTRENTAEMNRVLNGTQIITGIIGRGGNEIFISVLLFNYPNLIQFGRIDMRVTDKDELFIKIPEMVQRMQNAIVNATVQPLPEGLFYEIIEGRTVTITGYSGNAATLNIPSCIAGLPVTAIGDRAFREENRSLTGTTIITSATSLQNFLLGEDHRSLTSITIPSSVTSIGKYVFSNFNSLTNITVDNLNPVYASIDGVIFDKNIRTIISYPAGKTERTYTIPSSVTSIEDGAFSGCSSLTSVIIPSSVTSIGNFAFFICNSLISVTIPSSVTFIGNSAFSFCISLTSVIIPSSVTSIGDFAFSYCSNLPSVTIPSSVTSIGMSAFSSCRSLTSITLSRRTQVGEEAFPEKTQIIYSD